MNSTQIVLAVVGVLVLFIGPMFLPSRLAPLILFPRSLPALLGTMLFFPTLMIAMVGWMIVVVAAGERGAGDAIVAGFSALIRPLFGVMFLVIYAFCVLMALVSYFVGRMGERGGRAFAASQGLEFSKEGRSFKLNPFLGSTVLDVKNVVTLSADSFVGAFTETVASPGTSRGGYTFLSVAVGPMSEGGPSGTMHVGGRGGDDHEAIEAQGVTAMAPRGQAPAWRALLAALFTVVDPKRCPFGTVSAHHSQLTLFGGQLSSEKDYAQMAALLAAAKAPRPA